MALNGRVAEALAIRELRLRKAERNRRRRESTRDRLQRQQKAQRKEQRREQIELAFALIGILTAVAQHPISALEMRHRFGLPRDQVYPRGFGQQARARGIAVCLPGERRRISSEEGTRFRRLTQQERQELDAHLPVWLQRVRESSSHRLVRRVLRLWANEEEGEAGRRAFELIEVKSALTASKA
ncbi:MAG: hypothetical protein LC667_00455 [Thioalkalivibrio sp.]|nr:hypothetical protein [Thioalkalivibrio sp.]